MGLPNYIIQTFPPDLHKPMELVGDWMEEHSVKREDFTELKDIVRNLGVATQELAVAQKQTEIGLAELKTTVQELAEAQKRTEIGLEELKNTVHELSEAMKKGFERSQNQISALGSRWGIMNEETFRNTIEGLLSTTGYTVSKGYYGNREVDVVIKNGEHILLEITSSCKSSDIAKFIASADDYEVKTGKAPRIFVSAIFIGQKAMRALLDSPRKMELFSVEDEG